MQVVPTICCSLFLQQLRKICLLSKVKTSLCHNLNCNFILHGMKLPYDYKHFIPTCLEEAEGCSFHRCSLTGQDFDLKFYDFRQIY